MTEPPHYKHAITFITLVIPGKAARKALMMANSLDELTTLRYENTFDSPTWQSDLPILAPMQPWLQAQALLSEPSNP